MKGRLTSKQATIKLNRSEMMWLYTHLRDEVARVRNLINEEQRDMTTGECVIDKLEELCRLMYYTEKSQEINIF